ncbi:hypothetical protein L6452_42686 [Arctium lappa]|uniref:Uncharacterized protein n=1 Tax=Arctium lappa TaxID=4217 RepID=A0ACB8XKP4_ARCLA|nr:hypothetical protein L6452_42686 [Arctium lappa]
MLSAIPKFLLIEISSRLLDLIQRYPNQNAKDTNVPPINSTSRTIEEIISYRTHISGDRVPPIWPHAIEDGYSTCVTQRYGEDPSQHPTFDTDLWQEVSGGVKKGRTFGFGYHTDPNAILAGTSSGGGAASSRQNKVE